MRGPDDVDKNLTSTPARKFTPSCACVSVVPHMDAGCAREYLFLVELYPSWATVRVVTDWPDPYHGPGQAHGTRTRRHFWHPVRLSRFTIFLFTPCAFLLQVSAFRPTWCPGAPIA